MLFLLLAQHNKIRKLYSFTKKEIAHHDSLEFAVVKYLTNDIKEFSPTRVVAW